MWVQLFVGLFWLFKGGGLQGDIGFRVVGAQVSTFFLQSMYPIIRSLPRGYMGFRV